MSEPATTEAEEAQLIELLEMQPGTLDIVLFVIGLALGILGTGAVPRLKVPFLGDLGAPQKMWARIVISLVGLFLIGFAIARAKAVWMQTISAAVVWQEAGEHRAVQVVSDGDEVYVLTQRGNIFRIDDRGNTLIDNGTHTRQIEAAGGVLYVLKSAGDLWSILLHETESFDSSASAGASGITQGNFAKIDDGTATQEIEVAGETVYVLKESGQIWRRMPGAESWDRLGTQLPTVTEIESSGNILYYVTVDGCVGAYFPQPEAVRRSEQPADSGEHARPDCHDTQVNTEPVARQEGEEQHPAKPSMSEQVNRALASCGPVKTIDVDGRSVYLIDFARDAKKCLDGPREEFFEAVGENGARRIDAYGGVVYVLTSRDEIWRFRSGMAPKRYKEPSSDDGIAIETITGTAYGCYAIDLEGRVWLFSEHLKTKA